MILNRWNGQKACPIYRYHVVCLLFCRDVFKTLPTNSWEMARWLRCTCAFPICLQLLLWSGLSRCSFAVASDTASSNTHCTISNVEIHKLTETVHADFIPRIAPEVNYITGPEGDLPSIQIDDEPKVIFAENNFYTTFVNRMVKDYVPEIVTLDDLKDKWDLE